MPTMVVWWMRNGFWRSFGRTVGFAQSAGPRALLAPDVCTPPPNRVPAVMVGSSRFPRLLFGSKEPHPSHGSSGPWTGDSGPHRGSMAISLPGCGGHLRKPAYDPSSEPMEDLWCPTTRSVTSRPTPGQLWSGVT